LKTNFQPRRSLCAANEPHGTSGPEISSSCRGVIAANGARLWALFTKRLQGEARMAQISVTVNGRLRKAAVEPRLLLVHFLREHLLLTGTHVGCDTTQCGACTILVDGRTAKSCTLLAVQADGSEIITIEGLSKDGQLHPLQ